MLKSKGRLTMSYACGHRDVLLFVAADPSDTGPLELGDECAEIQRELTAVVVRG